MDGAIGPLKLVSLWAGYQMFLKNIYKNDYKLELHIKTTN
jgi:hypothetical protein